jgi:RecB family exonuclease
MKRLEEWAKNPEKGISVSAIQSYVLNPLEFFNRYVLRIGEELEVEEDIEGKTIGDIVHNTLENVYRDYEREVLTAEALVKIKNSYLHEMNRQFELKEYHPKDLEGQNYLIYQVSKQYIENQIRRDISDAQKAELIYHQGEEELRVQWQQTGSDMYYLQGKIDRIDSHNGKIRILDYKTGSIHLNKHISQDLFSDEKTKFEIQLLWYAYLYLSQNPHLTFEDIDVGLINLRDNAQINEATIKQEDMIRFEEQLREILNEIMNSKIPFKLNRQAKYFNTVAK